MRNYVVGHFLFGRGDDLRDDDSFLEKGVLDSTGVLELVAFLEETYGVKIENDELVPDNLDSINAIAEFIGRKQAARSSAA